MNLVVPQVEIAVRGLNPSDFPQVASIYKEGIATGIATFETEVPSWESWNKKYISKCRLVAVRGDEICGFAVMSQVSIREVYKGVAEVSIYVGERFRGKGIGNILLERLVKDSETHGYWTLQAGIFPENEASIRLHTSCGFRKIGVREKIGRLEGVWYDNVLVERRSQIINEG